MYINLFCPDTMDHVCIIGAGNMGSALIRGLARNSSYQITAIDPDHEALAAVEQHATETSDDVSVCKAADVVVLTVKPDIVDHVLAELELTSDQTLLTFAAGVSIASIADQTDATVVRAMPNLAAETGTMAAAVTENVTDDVRGILDAVGEFVEVDESRMDIATAINGSGPAFVFYLIDAMKAAGVQSDLDPDQAELLAAQTFKGAAETVIHDDRDVDELIDAVCSPNGTTIEGMEELCESDVQEEFGAAIEAAERRSKELAGSDDDE